MNVQEKWENEWKKKTKTTTKNEAHRIDDHDLAQQHYGDDHIYVMVTLSRVLLHTNAMSERKKKKKKKL